MRTLASAFLIVASNFAFQLGVYAQEPESKVIDTDCLLMVLDQVELAARRDGIIEQLHARVGDDVNQGELVLELGLSEAIAALQVARAKHDQAIVKAEDISAVRAAEVQLMRSVQEHKLLSEVGKVPYLELFRAENTRKKDIAELEIAKTTHKEDVHAAEITAAELKVAQINVDDRTIRSPVGGTIVKQIKFAGEWCNKGDPVIKILRMDKLMLQGIVNVKDIAPHQVVGMKAKAVFELAGQNPVELSDLTIEKVNPEIDLDGNYVIWTFIDNKKGIGTDGKPSWFLRPGISGALQITTDEDAKLALKIPVSY